MEVAEDFESRPHNQCLLWLTEKRRCRNGVSRGCRRCSRVTAEKGCQDEAPKKEVEKKRREDMNSRGRKVRYEIAQEVFAGIKEKAGGHEDAKSTARRKVGQSVKQSWECSQIENEEEEEEEVWQKENQMEWGEDEKLEETLGQRRVERYSLQAEVMQKAPESVVHERMSQGKGVKCTKEKKKVKGWSNEEIKGKPSSSSKEDTKEM